MSNWYRLSSIEWNCYKTEGDTIRAPDHKWTSSHLRRRNRYRSKNITYYILTPCSCL